MLGLVFGGKSTAAILALSAHFLVSQRVLLVNGEFNADCLPAALDAAMRIVGHRVDATTLARARPDGTIQPGVTPDVVRIDRERGDPTAGELERLRIELVNGAGLASGIAYAPGGGLVRNQEGHDHGTPPSGVPNAIALEGLHGANLTPSAASVIAALRSSSAVVMGGTVGWNGQYSCHATTAVGVDPNTGRVVVLDPEASAVEITPAQLQTYLQPQAGHTTIFGCPSFAYAVAR